MFFLGGEWTFRSLSDQLADGLTQTQAMARCIHPGRLYSIIFQMKCCPRHEVIIADQVMRNRSCWHQSLPSRIRALLGCTYGTLWINAGALMRAQRHDVFDDLAGVRLDASGNGAGSIGGSEQRNLGIEERAPRTLGQSSVGSQ